MLSELIQDLPYIKIVGDVNKEISEICFHSKHIKDNGLFVCIKGYHHDTHHDIDELIKKGIKVFVISREMNYQEGITYILVEDTLSSLSLICRAFFIQNKTLPYLIGITGTKGKTTITYLLKNILEKEHLKVGVIGTNGITINQQHYSSLKTTPDPYELFYYLSLMIDESIDICLMEVSSASLKQKRVNGLLFDIAVFTNLSYDHINQKEHTSFEEYKYYKSLLFNQSEFNIYNSDDIHCLDFNHSIPYMTYGFKNQDLHVTDYSFNDYQSMIDISGLYNERFIVSLIGTYNIYNTLAALCVCYKLQISQKSIREGLADVSILGRFERIDNPFGYHIIIDYAHNSESFKAVIKTVLKNHPHHIYLVYGSGGERSKYRRNDVGKVAAYYKCISIITMDNPRHESIDVINKDIIEGIKEYDGEYIVIKDRKKAIEYVLSIASKDDYILLLGKGHERYQQINSLYYPFNERQIVEEYILKHRVDA